MPRQQRYVFCPFCNDPVPGPLPGAGEFLECGYGNQTFPFEPQAVQIALLEYHEAERRWMVVPIHTEMDAQTARILHFCGQSAPGCIVHILPVGPDSFRLRVRQMLFNFVSCLTLHCVFFETPPQLFSSRYLKPGLVRTPTELGAIRKPVGVSLYDG